MRSRKDPKDRKTAILGAAIALSRRHGVGGFKRDDVAVKARCSTGLISHYFGGMTGLRAAIKNAARTDGALAADLKRQALATLN